MSLEEKLRTIAILAKHLRGYAPLLAAIGQTKVSRERQYLVEKIAQQFARDTDEWADLMDVLALVLGQKANFDIQLLAVLDEFKRSWQYNKMGDALLLCLKLGIITKSDLANWTWVGTNWSEPSGKS